MNIYRGESADRNGLEGLRDLYETDSAARTLFQWAAARQNDATVTSIERIAQVAGGVDRRKAIELAKELERLGCGKYVIGRRGAATRIEWERSLKSIGRAAIGQSGELEKADPELIQESADLLDLKNDDKKTDTPTLTITEAKERLAATFGVSPDKIEITIRA